AEPILPSFGKDARERISREVMELVNHQEEVFPKHFRNACTAHRSELKLGREKRSEQIGFVLAELAFGEISDEDSLVIHHEAQINLALYLAEDVPDRRVHEKGAELILNRCDRLALETWIVVLKFVKPKRAKHWISDLLHHPLAVSGVDEDTTGTQERDVL